MDLHRQIDVPEPKLKLAINQWCVWLSEVRELMGCAACRVRPQAEARSKAKGRAKRARKGANWSEDMYFSRQPL
jgi:hypothetical protein